MAGHHASGEALIQLADSSAWPVHTALRTSATCRRARTVGSQRACGSLSKPFHRYAVEPTFVSDSSTDHMVTSLLCTVRILQVQLLLPSIHRHTEIVGAPPRSGLLSLGLKHAEFG